MTDTTDLFNDPDFEFDPAAADPFADVDDAVEEWLKLPGEPSDTIDHDLLLRATAEDPFATSHLDDCLPALGVTPSALSRYERASAAYVAACHSPEQDDEAQEIHRLVAAYWLKKSRAFWLA